MNRTYGIILMLVAGLSIPALAQDQGAGKERGARGRAARGDAERPPRGGLGGGFGFAGPRSPDQIVEQLNKELDLSQDQQDKIRNLVEDHHQKMRARMTENRDKMMDLQKQMAEARDAGDKEKAREVGKQMRAMRGGPVEADRQKLITDIEGTLTADQKAKFATVKDKVFSGQFALEQHPEMLMRAVESLKLPKERMDKVKAIVDDWKSKARASRDRKAAMAGASDVYKKVMDELTPEEQAKIKAWRPEPGAMMMRSGPGERREAPEGRGRRGNRPHNNNAGAPGAAESK